jgi:hypothetical protein
MNQNKTRYLVRFRAFNRDDKTLYTWDMFEGYPLKGVNATVPQEYTGVCDKNLQDIFVGDIVHYQGQNYLVRFRYGGYMLWKLENISTLKFWWFHDVFDKFGDMEVVGNTFEMQNILLTALTNKMNLKWDWLMIKINYGTAG